MTYAIVDTREFGRMITRMAYACTRSRTRIPASVVRVVRVICVARTRWAYAYALAAYAWYAWYARNVRVLLPHTRVRVVRVECTRGTRVRAERTRVRVVRVVRAECARVVTAYTCTRGTRGMYAWYACTRK